MKDDGIEAVTKTSSDIKLLQKEVQLVISDAKNRNAVTEAYNLLLLLDANNQPKGIMPYTREALEAFERLHTLDPEDLRVVHHLAIAHHAYAWDLELQNDEKAKNEWESALHYWRILGRSQEFWNTLKNKLLLIDSSAHTALLDDLRANLLEYLLDIHVEFIRKYMELGCMERAFDHVTLIHKTELPLGIKKRLTDKVFRVMTDSVSNAAQACAFESTLVTLQKFLFLFPDYLPALRMYAEVCKEWIGLLSYQHDWNTIVTLSQESEVKSDALITINQYLEQLLQHPGIHDEPLAQKAIEELVAALIERCEDRGVSYMIKHGDGAIPVSHREEAQASFTIGITWGQLLLRHGFASSLIRELYARCWLGIAYCARAEIKEIFESGADQFVKIEVALKLGQKLISELSTVVTLTVNDRSVIESIKDNIAIFKSLVDDCQSEQLSDYLFGSEGD